MMIVSAVYLTCVMMMASLSLVCTIIVLQLHYHNTTTRPPHWLKTLTVDYMARFLCMYSRKDPRFQSSMSPTQNDHRENHRTNTHHRSISKDMDEMDEKTSVRPNNNMGKKRESDQSSEYMHDAMSSLVQLAGTVADNITHGDEKDRVHAEWVLIAKIFDRFFAITFLTVTISVSTLLLGIYPMFGPAKVEPSVVS